MNVTCVIAHQDDEMSCLGTLLRLHHERSARISFVALTNGDRGMSWSPDVPLSEAAAIRAREMQAVADAFAGTYLCLEQPDEFLFDTVEVRLGLIEAIRATGADLVFTHWLEDYNQDHVTTARLTCHASLLAEIASIRTGSPALSRAPKIFHMNPGEGHGFDGTHFVLIPPGIAEQKSRLIRLHGSQMDVLQERFGRDYADLIADRDRLAGARIGAPFAEVFRPCLMDRRVPLASSLP